MALWGAMAIASLLFIYAVRGILLPFILAIVVTAILTPGYKWLKSKRWNDLSAALVLILAFFGTILVALIALMPVMTSQISGLKDRGEEIVTSLSTPDPLDNFFMRGNPENRFRAAQKKDPVDQFLSQRSELLTRFKLPTSKRAIIAQYIEPQRDQITNALRSVLTNSISTATGLVSQGLTLIFVPLLVLFLLPNQPSLRRKVLNLIPPQLRVGSLDMAEDIGDVFTNYLRGVSIAVFGYMAFMAILLTILGAPYGLLLGLMFGALYLVPYLNVAISATTLILVTGLSGKASWLGIQFSSSWVYALVLCSIYVVCHFLFDSAVYPRFVGQAVGLDPIVSMFVIFSGGALFGLPGMILAFPVAGSVKVILDRMIRVTNKVEKELSLPEIPLRHREESL